ncbi:RNA methyltransferase [Corallococcus terminator]|uniref:RNA methyltransferase n=1 Tax=Corallococcus terminator TaxID=2316733 RepID=A0A3A8JF25_9BACT|nr:RNA methyltransferase [Corallococcus terminator]RKG93608.1 RNA methyltransferase [Corallococcus terminator]
MVRTLRDAEELVRTRHVITEVPTHGPTSLVEQVMGGRPAGSWREHAKGRLAYRLGRQLRASPDVLAVRLVEGKVAFVDPTLWASVYRVAMEPGRRRPSLQGLSLEARSLLSSVERDGRVKMDKEGPWTKAREALEERLLVHFSEAQEEDGHHVAVLRSWRDWASPELKADAARLSYEDAQARLRAACDGAPTGLGPWVF